MRLAGIDVGASYLKGAVLDIDERRVEAVRQSAFPPFSSVDAGRREADPLLIAGAAAEVLRGLRRDAPDIAGVLLCGQMHGLVLVGADGEPASPFVSWQDQRLLEPAGGGAGTFWDALASRISPEEVRALGNELRPGLPIGTLFWFAEREPRRLEDSVPASLLDFVAGRLCDSSAAVTHPTNAAAHGAYALGRGAWHPDVLERLGLAGLRWPAVVPTGHVVGETRVGGDRPLPVFVPVGDQQAALYGAELTPGEVSLNVATGSQVSTLVDSPEPGDFQVRPYFDGRWLATITHIPAGRALNALLRLLGEMPGTSVDDAWAYALEAAASAGDSEVDVDLSFFPSATGSRGRLAGLTEETLNVGSVVRAALRSMAERYETLALRLPAGRWRSGVVFSGGLVRKNALLRRMIETRFPGPSRSAPAEDALHGLLRLASGAARGLDSGIVES